MDEKENVIVYTSHLVYNKPEWKCQLIGDDSLVLYPKYGQEPNWFWRKMQYLIFGFKWVKI